MSPLIATDVPIGDICCKRLGGQSAYCQADPMGRSDTQFQVFFCTQTPLPSRPDPQNDETGPARGAQLSPKPDGPQLHKNRGGKAPLPPLYQQQRGNPHGVFPSMTRGREQPTMDLVCNSNKPGTFFRVRRRDPFFALPLGRK